MEENVRIWIPHFQQRRYCIFKSDFKIIGGGVIVHFVKESSQDFVI